MKTSYKYDKSAYDIYYHGSPNQFEVFDLKQARGFKDFGPGFYLSDDFSHAQARALRLSSKEAPAFVYTYLVPKKFTVDTSVRVFKGASEPWLDFVLFNREQPVLAHSFDVVLGATADAETVTEIDAYYAGACGKVGSFEAKGKLIKRLKPYVLGHQICLTSLKAIQQVIRIDETCV